MGVGASHRGDLTRRGEIPRVVMCSKSIVPGLISIALMLCAGGCYKHVVKAEGAAPGRYDLYEPNVGDDSSSSHVIDKTTTTQLKASKKAPTPPTKTNPPPTKTNP